jgi:hypothetical protein
MYDLNFYFNDLDSSYLNILFGFFYSLPLNVPNLINFRHFILEGFEVGLSSFLGTALSCFLFFSLIFNGNQSIIGFWHFIEPILSLLGLVVGYRLASSFHQNSNEKPPLQVTKLIVNFFDLVLYLPNLISKKVFKKSLSDFAASQSKSIGTVGLMGSEQGVVDASRPQLDQKQIFLLDIFLTSFFFNFL